MSRDTGGRRIGAIVRYIVLPLIILAVVASFLPLIETNAWFVRIFDFPRLQLFVALLALGIVYLLARPPRTPAGWIPVVLVAAALGTHATKLYHYLPMMEEDAVALAEYPAGSRVRVLIANIEKGNRHAAELFRIVRAADPDLFLAMETDEWWDRRLTELHGAFPHRIQRIPDGHAFFGIHLLSKYDLVGPEIRLLAGSFAPSVFTGVRLPDGATVAFYGLHPRPPIIGQSSVFRDEELISAALAARASQNPVIVAGDLNAVPWEGIVRLAMRVGELLDPRVGRGFHPTFDAQSVLMSWPLDQILYQDAFGLLSFRRLPAFGSDHYPVLADLCHTPGVADRQAAPPLEEDDLEEAKEAIEAYRGQVASGG
jgi:endonuclease/exonuclease/phosphatase (EEP) superfamily protein YafD